MSDQSEHYLRLDEAEFERTYRPLIDEHGTHRSFHPAIPQERLSLLAAHAEHRVWTVLDVDGFSILSSGWHVVNRLHHVIAAVPLDPAMQVEVFDLDDRAEWESRLARAELLGLDCIDELPED